MIIYFISEESLKDTTILNENVDPKLIAPAIVEAQDIHIQTLIGSGLYDKMKTLVASGGISQAANAAYKTLLDSYIQPALKYYVLAELVFPMTVKFMNKSVASRNSDNASSIPLDEVARTMEHYKTKAEWYGKRLINYLRDNVIPIPEYTSIVTPGFSTIIPKSTSYTSGMYLGDGDCGCENGMFNFNYKNNG